MRKNLKNSAKNKIWNYSSLIILIETHKTRWDWKTILNVALNVPLNETHKTTWRGQLVSYESKNTNILYEILNVISWTLFFQGTNNILWSIEISIDGGIIMRRKQGRTHYCLKFSQVWTFGYLMVRIIGLDGVLIVNLPN